MTTYADANARAQLALEVYEAVSNADVSFYGKTGGDLAYLMAAILKGTQVDLSRRSPLARILAGAFKIGNPGHPVWDHVELR